MDRINHKKYIEILKEELVPALGCTEPTAIAYASAMARDALGVFPSRLKIYCSGNIIKNVKSVTVPNTGGLKGIEASALAGALVGNAEHKMEVLAHLEVQQAAKIAELLGTGQCQ